MPLILEYESVLTRPEQLAASGATTEDVAAVLDELAAIAKSVQLTIRARPMLPDPKDEMVLETAVNSRADAIVTFDILGQWPSAFAACFCPGEVLRRLAEGV